MKASGPITAARAQATTHKMTLMRVVAARFSEVTKASVARDLLRTELAVEDVEVAALGHPGEPVCGDAVLASRVSEEQANEAVELVERAGGEIVADIDESWTRSTH